MSHAEADDKRAEEAQAAGDDERLLFSPKPVKRPPSGARCAHCGCPELSCLPTFSAGAGVAFRPVADDVFCHRCGHIAPPAL